MLLLDQDRKFDSFGFDAEEKYGDLLMDEEAEGWSLFRRFKMVLYDNPVSTEDTTRTTNSSASLIKIMKNPLALNQRMIVLVIMAAR